VAAICKEAAGASQVVEPVNFNGPEQIVIAGHKEAVERAIDLATNEGRSAASCCPYPHPFTVRCSGRPWNALL
jgi:[acyl-carrier-protein] S-malonyltransferase